MLNHADAQRRNVRLVAAAARDEDSGGEEATGSTTSGGGGGGALDIVATREIAAGSELLTCYADADDYDDEAAAHLLLQWGIPSN